MSVVWEVPFPTATQMLICLKLADYANDHGGSIFPANSTLADKARCSESTVKVTIKALRACGILHLVRAGGNGPRDTNEWVLNVPMLKALADGSAVITGCSDTLEIDGFSVEVSDVQEPENKGSEKGSKINPFTTVRGQSGELRGQPTGAKGSAGKPQSINNHQKDTSGSRESASDEGARSPRLKAEPSLILPNDWQWSKWIIWADDRGSRKKFEAEGGMVVFADEPKTSVEPPKLPPLPGSPRYSDLMAKREERLSRARGKMAAAGEAA